MWKFKFDLQKLVGFYFSLRQLHQRLEEEDEKGRKVWKGLKWYKEPGVRA